MRAQETRAGGRFLAGERGAFDRDEPEDKDLAIRNPLIERLSAESLAALGEYLGISLKELEERYQ